MQGWVYWVSFNTPAASVTTVTGQGMASELPWDGTLQFEELLMPLQLTERKVILE